MDFTGSIINEFNSLPKLWWLCLLVTFIIVCIVEKLRKKSTKQIIIEGLLATYIVFILFQTIIGRNTVSKNAEWTLFWSYSIPQYRIEIILNYILFIPLGTLLYLLLGNKYGLKVVLIGFGLSICIELIQLIFKIGLFEFDDIFGNTIGCFIGCLLGKVIIDAVRSYRNNHK